MCRWMVVSADFLCLGTVGVYNVGFDGAFAARSQVVVGFVPLIRDVLLFRKPYRSTNVSTES
jgi:hypothetical protein